MDFKFYIICCALTLNAFKIKAQTNDLVYDNNIYLDYIKSVKIAHAGLETSFPIVDFDSDYQGRLLLSFDDLEGGYKRYTYRLIHCDMNWNPSTQLEEIEYLDGFNYQDINNYSYSTNGYSDYTHYRLVLPNEDVRWIISGNYLLVIYHDDLNIPVITRRFMVAETKINIMHELIKPRDVRKLDTHNELRLTLSYKNFKIVQPMTELFVTVLQNGNWNTAKNSLRGTYERGESLVFDELDQIVFPGLKEFRSFDIRPLAYTTQFVNSIEQDEIETTVFLDPNRRRSGRNALDEIDANGFFIIDNERYADPEVSSEYCRVVYNLQADYPFDRDLYIVGAFSDFQARDEYKLDYDPSQQMYIGEAYFKQGYYDYMFALQNLDGSLDFETVEGSWFETENDYQILVYYRQFGSFYDRLIAVKSFNSNP